MPSYALPQIDLNDSVPATGHTPAQDYSIMQSNEVANFNIWNVDHIGYSTTGSGYHQQVRMPNFTSNSVGVPPPAVISGFGGVYCDNTISNSPTTETGLWFTPDASTNKYQLTRTITANFATFGQFVNHYPGSDDTQFSGGWTFLPGGLLYQYGTWISNSGTPAIPGSLTVVFPVPFTNATPVINITMVCKSGGTSSSVTPSIRPDLLTNTQFKINFNGATPTYIGVHWSASGI